MLDIVSPLYLKSFCCIDIFVILLYRSLAITDVGIAAVAVGCPALEMINIAYNDKVTDASLRSLSRCFSLKALEIRGCPRVSSEGLSAIAVGCRQLKVLDIKKCFNINDNGMLPLAQFSQNLKQVLCLSKSLGTLKCDTRLIVVAHYSCCR